MGHSRAVYGADPAAPQPAPSARLGTSKGCMTTRAAISSLFLAVLCITGRADERATHAQVPAGDVRPVADLDVERYMGRWYELGRTRTDSRKNAPATWWCTTSPDPTAASTSPTPAGQRQARSKRWGSRDAPTPPGPASVLEVRFAPAFLSFLPVWGDYWVLDLDRDYRTAVVGTPNREYLWILSRTPHADAATYARLVESARSQGYDVTRIVRTTHRVGLPAGRWSTRPASQSRAPGRG